MQRIAIIGNGGSGKSTLARKLSAKLNIPAYHLDKIFLNKNYVNIPKPEMTIQHNNIIENDKWIIDGNYSHTMGERFERADTIIMLDFPTWLCVWRIYKRTFSKEKRTDVPDGCANTVDMKFLSWVLGYKKRAGNKMLNEVLPQYKLEKRIYVLRNTKDVDKFLSEVK